MASLHPAPSLQFFPDVQPLPGSKCRSWEINTTSPCASPLICATARLPSLGEKGCLLVDRSLREKRQLWCLYKKNLQSQGGSLSCPVCLCLLEEPGVEVSQTVQLFLLCFPAWQCSMALKRKSVGVWSWHFNLEPSTITDSSSGLWDAISYPL